MADQFSRLRTGDSFWYERDYPLSIIDEIDETFLSNVIMRNTPLVGLQENVFKY